MFVHDRIVRAAAAEDAAVDLGMQRFDATVHHLGQSGVRGNVLDRNACFGEQARSAAGGQDFDAQIGKAAGESFDAAFVRDAEQRTGDGTVVGHGAVPDCFEWGGIIAGEGGGHDFACAAGRIGLVLGGLFASRGVAVRWGEQVPGSTPNYTKGKWHATDLPPPKAFNCGLSCRHNTLFEYGWCDQRAAAVERHGRVIVQQCVEA